jgi:hypothetical protein
MPEHNEKRRFNSSAHNSPIKTIDHYLRIENVQCLGQDGQAVEEYPELYVDLQISGETTGTDALSHSNESVFIPSFRLTMAILDRCYQEYAGMNQGKEANSNAIRFLFGHFDAYYGKDMYRQIITNTVMDGQKRVMIDYPLLSDLTRPDARAIEINSGKRYETSVRHELSSSLITAAILDEESIKAVQEITGLEDPRFLADRRLHREKRVTLSNPRGKGSVVGIYSDEDEVALISDCTSSYARYRTVRTTLPKPNST